MKYKNPYKKAGEEYKIYKLGNDILKSSQYKLSFNVDVKISSGNERIFLGLVNPNQTYGIAVSVDKQTGEIEDVLNNQGIIGYLINVPIPRNQNINIGIEIDKYNSVYLPVLKIGNDRILHPALYIEAKTILNPYTGTSLQSKSKERAETAKSEIAVL